MKKILLATDLSNRSDRACRRAVLLARQFGSSVTILHVVDNDQPAAMSKSAEREASTLLGDLAFALKQEHKIDCDYRVVLGESFRKIADVAGEIDADLVVMGSHRREFLRDIFIGTTIERTMRQTRCPVLMTNAVPGRSYGRVLIATDFSDCSEHSISEAKSLGLLDKTDCVVLHVFDTLAEPMMKRTGLSRDSIKSYVAEEDEQAQFSLEAFVQKTGLQPGATIARKLNLSIAHTILLAAKEYQTDLVLVGNHGRTGPAKFFLGSVAEECLRHSEIDVLVVSLRAD